MSINDKHELEFNEQSFVGCEHFGSRNDSSSTVAIAVAAEYVLYIDDWRW